MIVSLVAISALLVGFGRHAYHPATPRPAPFQRRTLMSDLLSGDRPLDHVAIAVPSLEDACHLFELISGHRCTDPETLESQGVRVAFCGSIEILEPLGPGTSVGRFLERRGPALHHVAYLSDDLPADLTRLRDRGVELIDAIPRQGARGHKVAFLHPRSTGGILVELVQRGG
jgi:methylmalonyl-CoA/ethylmalonyl-CoA epimerase